MPVPFHHIRRLSVDVTVPDLDLAVALRSRLEDLANLLFPQVLERVLDAVLPADRHARLLRLDLDLGTIDAGRLEADAVAALETALVSKLTDALECLSDAPAAGGSTGDRLLTPEETLTDLAEHYLTGGTYPYWAAAGAPPSPRLLAILAAGQPKTLADILRRHSRNAVVAERLVLQLGEEGLRQVLSALAPADAAVILAYLTDLSLLHRAEPLLSRPAPAVDRLFWLVTVEYLVREAGSQFNRRSFLRELLLGIADHEKVGYAALLDLLRQGIERLGRQRPLGSSLPAVLQELLDAERPLATFPKLPNGGEPAQEAAVAPLEPAAVPDDDEALLTLMRRNLRNPAVLEALAARLSPRRFARLVERLEPAHALLILAFLADLLELHREDALLLLSAEGFERLTRLLTLIQLLRDPGSQFNRRSWLRFLLEGMAEREKVAYALMLDLLARSLARTAARRSPSSSLPGLVTELVAEEAGRPARADHAVPALRDAGDLAPGDLAARFRKAATGPAADLARLVDGLDDRRRATILPAILKDLQPALAPLMGEVMDWLLRRHRSRPLMALSEAAFARLLWTAVLRRAAVPGARPADRVGSLAFLESVMGDLAAFDGLAPASVIAGATGTSGEEAAGEALPPPLVQLRDAHRVARPDLAAAGGILPLAARASRFLRLGTPAADGDSLVPLLESDPAGLLGLLRDLAADEAHWPERLDRLLGRLLPEEIAALPGLEHGGDAACRVRALADGMGAGAELVREEAGRAVAWKRVLTALLRSDAPGIAVPLPPAGRKLDRPAVLRSWLDHGRVPWWADGAAASARVVAGLPDLPLTELLALFQCSDPARTVSRLHRAVEALGRDAAMALLRRLAPGAFAPGWLDRTPSANPPSPGEERERLHRRLSGVAALIDGRVPPAGGEYVGPDSAAPAVEAGAEPEGTSGPAQVGRRTLLGWLSGDGDDPPWSDALVRELADLLDTPDPEVDATVTAALRNEAVRARWLARLPEEILGRLLHRIEPALADMLLELVGTVEAAWRQAMPPERRGGDPRRPWAVLLGSLAAAAPGHRSARAVAAALLKGLSGGDPATEKPLIARARFLAGEAGHAGLLAVLQPPPAPTSPPAHKAVPTAAPASWPSRRTGEGAAAPASPLYIDNAGLVLLNPFLPHFFERLGVLSPTDTGAPRVATPEAAAKAVHLLQHLADGVLEDGRCIQPEPALVLNKLLCGLDPAVPIAPEYRPAPEELALCDQLLAAAIGNWTIISNSSAAGLRETFLRREGRLEHGDRGWSLTVQRKTVDVLVDRIPWSFATLYHRWMEEPLHVSW
ncbi:hypothetical protein EI613_17160 [Azospirillum sp. 412522]|nr:contractile injection system tape measure protein [Azospirillum sp. 412522]MBY6263629.1 hypothetical protein [Azospirillum sp. 412522]